VRKELAEKKFWARVDKELDAGNGAGCWYWTGGRTDRGYGRLTIHRTVVRAHRHAYITSKGPIPNGLGLDHLCRNPACVNPAHLEAVTNRTNALRGVGVSAVNAKKTHCIRGHEFTRENTYQRRGKRGRVWRQCRECSLAGGRRARRARSIKQPRDDILVRSLPVGDAGEV